MRDTGDCTDDLVVEPHTVELEEPLGDRPLHGCEPGSDLDADSLDVGRRPSQILTFSQGSHHCLGAAAARLQGRVALEELLAAYPDFEVDPAGVRWAPGPYVRRPAAVPFVGRP